MRHLPRDRYDLAEAVRSMTLFADTLSLREARAQFFAANAETFGQDGGYDRKWIRLEIGPIPVFMPNMAGRDRAVRLHDLHHIVTGYQTDLKGEAEIGAWEVGSGCGDFWHAWVLNMWAFALGLLIAPRRTFRAFVRGRRTDNLYHHHARLEEALLEESVGGMRQRLRLSRSMPPASMRESAAFAWWAMLSALLTTAPLVIAFAVIAMLLRWIHW